MQLYSITDRRLFASPEALVEQAALWARNGVDFVQIREKDLPADELAALSARIVRAVRLAGSRTRVLLNGPAQVATAAGCDGVHLVAGLPGSAVVDARKALADGVADPVVSVSCHTNPEIERARDHGASLALFAPVFEKRSGAESTRGQGLAALAAVCRAAGPMPVFALGGITAANAGDCIQAGAAGVAGIRLFAGECWVGLRGPL